MNRFIILLKVLPKDHVNRFMTTKFQKKKLNKNQSVKKILNWTKLEIQKVTYCPLFLCHIGIGTVGFFAEGKKREENSKDPLRKDRNQPQSQFVGNARFGEASALKNGLSLILNQKGKNQSKINCHSPLFVVLSCKAYPILIHYINDSTVVEIRKTFVSVRIRYNN